MLVQSGTLDFTDGGSASASAFTVAAGTTLEFAGGTFTLSVDQSQTFTGTIGALTSTAPGDAVDLKDINYAGATKTYVGTTTSGC